MSLPNNIWTGFNQSVLEWTESTWRKQSELLQSKIKKGTDRLVSSLRYRNKKDMGMIVHAGFQFERHGVYLEKGVGGVYHVAPKKSGVVVRKTSGPINRTPQPWLNPVMSEQLPDLTRRVSEGFAKVTGAHISESLEVTVKAKGIN